VFSIYNELTTEHFETHVYMYVTIVHVVIIII